MCKIQRNNDVYEPIQPNSNGNGNSNQNVKEQDRVIQNCIKVEQEGGVQVMGLGNVHAKTISVEEIQNAEKQVEVKKSHVKRNLLIVAGVLLLIGAVLIGAGVAALTAGAAVAVYASLMSVGGAFFLAGGIMGIVGLCLKNKNKKHVEEQAV